MVFSESHNLFNWNHARMTLALGELDAVVSRLVRSVHLHPQRLVAVTAATLLSIGGGAFALVAIDAAPEDVVVREVIESIPSLEMNKPYAALPETASSRPSGLSASACGRSPGSSTWRPAGVRIWLAGVT